jgi:hypothetical protein
MREAQASASARRALERSERTMSDADAEVRQSMVALAWCWMKGAPDAACRAAGLNFVRPSVEAGDLPPEEYDALHRYGHAAQSRTR